MKRLAAIAATLLACQSALALTVDDSYAGHMSVALGQSTAGGLFLRLVDDAGQPATGVGYTFTLDGSCATFNDGSTTFTGTTDAGGFTSSPLLTGHQLGPD